MDGDLTQWQSSDLGDLIAAMNAAQQAMKPALKDRENPFFHSRYADLGTVWESLSPFRDHGIVFTQSPMNSPDGYIVLDTQLTHLSGQWMRSRLKMRVSKDDPQGAGSALTYARRYALGCMTGLVTENDDDGNLASGPPTTRNFADIHPAQHAAIQEKLKSAPHSMPVRSSVAADAWVVPIGRQKGQPVTDQSDDNLQWCLGYYLEKLNAPANMQSRYREEWETAVLHIRAEQLARIPPPEE